MGKTQKRQVYIDGWMLDVHAYVADPSGGASLKEDASTGCAECGYARNHPSGIHKVKPKPRDKG